MIAFRISLLAGLVLHKVAWIVMKRRGRDGAPPKDKTRPPRAVLARLVKLAILLLIAVQIFVVDVLPILDRPLALRIVGGILYIIGLVTAVLGRVQLGDSWSDIEVGHVGAEHQVISTGVYRYLRHPIYVGDLLLLLGLQLSLNSWLVGLVVVMIPPVLARAVQEEKALCEMLTGYDDYARRTKRFIPFVV